MALIKKGGTSRLGGANYPDSNRPNDAEQTPPAASEDVAPASPVPDDSTRAIRTADDSTRSIKPPADDATRSIKPPADDATRSINPQADDATRSIPRLGTEAIREQSATPQTSVRPRLSAEVIRRKAQESQTPQRPEETARAMQSAALPPNTLLQNRYIIEDVHGVGGMSVVYRGRDTRFKEVSRYCAIKEMFQSSPDSQTRLLSLKNFEREAGLLATLNHPAIPKIYDFFEENGRAYLVLELIPGADLETVLENSKEPLDELRVGHWAMQICDVLNYLHHHEPEPIIFRDLKPSNMIVSTNDRIVLIDFGIARIFTRLDKKGTMIGTEGYSPPEQYRGIAEARGDVYALGATMHHLLTNSDPRLETPFTFQDRPIRQINPRVSPEMEAVVMKALEYDMANRWESAQEFRQALLQVPGLAGAAGATSLGSSVALPRMKGASGTEVLWSFKCEEEVRSSPCVRNGLLFVGCYDTNLYALDIKRGSFVWKRPTNGGISSSPTVWNDMVIVGSDDNNVYAFDTRTGTPRWTFRTEKPVRSSPRTLDRLIFIGSDDQHLYAIDGTNGRQIWRYRAWQWFRATPYVHTTLNLIFIGSGDGSMFCLDAFKGGLRWKQKLGGGIMSSATVTDKLVLVGSMDNVLYALDIEGGWPVWKFRTNHYVNSSPVVLGNRAFVGGIDGNVYAVDIKNGKSIWQYETGAQIISTPALDGGKLYIGSADGVVHCVDSGSGASIWKHACDGPIVGSPTVENGVVYIGSLDHSVYALKA